MSVKVVLFFVMLLQIHPISCVLLALTQNIFFRQADKNVKKK